MRKVMLSVLILVVLAGVMSGAASAQNGSDVPVWVYEDGAEICAGPEDNIIFLDGWLATTRGLVNMFLGAYTMSFTLYDEDNVDIFSLSEEESDDYWGPIMSMVPEDWGLSCPMPYIAGVLWEYDYGALEEGTYTLITEWDFRHPVNDGYHACTDPETGEPVSPTPSLYPAESGTATITIYVGICPL